jgi:cytochrome b561
MPVKYHISIRILHWLMALIIISLLAMGFYMGGLDNTVSYRNNLYGLHKSFGTLVLILIFIRIFFRITRPVPALPNSMSLLVRKSAHFVHYILYLLMILMPLSGYLMSNSFGYPVNLFSIPLPNLISVNPELGKFFAESHELLAFILIGVLTIHIIAVIKHRFFDLKEHNILKRMI